MQQEGTATVDCIHLFLGGRPSIAFLKADTAKADDLNLLQGVMSYIRDCEHPDRPDTHVPASMAMQC